MAIMQYNFHQPQTKKAEPGRQHAPVEVTRLACGADLRLSLHVLTGHKDGPTLGILTTVHGDETFPLMAVRELLNSFDPKTLVGRIAAIPGQSARGYRI